MTYVLVVEDDIAVRELVEALLTDEGYEVRTASDGLEAVDALLVSPGPMVVLLDVLMPRMGGDAVLRLVSEGEGSLARHVYILMTALASSLPDDLSQLARSLDVPVLAKPFDIERVLRTVETAKARLDAPVHA